MLKFIGFCAVLWFLFWVGIAQALFMLTAGILMWLAAF